MSLSKHTIETALIALKQELARHKIVPKQMGVMENLYAVSRIQEAIMNLENEIKDNERKNPNGQ